MSSSFLPAKKNFQVARGSTFRYLFEWKDELNGETKPHNLEPYAATCTLHGVNALEDIVLTTENEGIKFGGLSKEPTNGLIELYIKDSQVEEITFTRATYTLFVIELLPPEDKLSLLSGSFTISSPS